MKGQTVFAPSSVSGEFLPWQRGGRKSADCGRQIRKNFPQSGSAQIANIRLKHTLGNQ